MQPFWGKSAKLRHLKFSFFSSTNRLHGVLGFRPPNLEAVAQVIFTIRTTTLVFLLNLLLLISKKCRVRELLKPIDFLATLRTLVQLASVSSLVA